MDRLPIAGGFSAIQNNSGLSQGLWSAIGGTVGHKHGKHLDASWEPKGSRSMNMSVTEFVVPPAIVGRNRSVWRQIIERRSCDGDLNDLSCLCRGRRIVALCCVSCRDYLNRDCVSSRLGSNRRRASYHRLV